MNGKGDRNRSNPKAFRDGWDRVFGKEPKKHYEEPAIRLPFSQITSLDDVFIGFDEKEEDS
jgi:hypothetical protein